MEKQKANFICFAFCFYVKAKNKLLLLFASKQIFELASLFAFSSKQKINAFAQRWLQMLKNMCTSFMDGPFMYMSNSHSPLHAIVFCEWPQTPKKFAFCLIQEELYYVVNKTSRTGIHPKKR